MDEEKRKSLPPPSSTSSASIPIKDIIAPLENGGLGPLDYDNVFGMYPHLFPLPQFNNQCSTLLHSSEQDSVLLDSSLEADLSNVEPKDTSSILADLDSEVSTMVKRISCDSHVIVM